MAIFTAIASAIGAVGTFIAGLGAVGSFVLKTAVGIGLNLLAQAIAGKPKEQPFAMSGTMQIGGDVSRSIVLGRAAVPGSLVWMNTWGKDGDTPNAYFTQCIALADHPVKGIDEMWVNDERVEVDVSAMITSSGDGNVIGKKATNYTKAYYALQWGRDKDLLSHLPGGHLPASLGAFISAVEASGVGSIFQGRFENRPVEAGTPQAFIDHIAAAISFLGGIATVNPANAELGTPIVAFRKDGHDHMWVRFYDGTQTSADPLLTGRASNANRQWQSSRVGKGVAYAVVTFRNKKNMFSGVPTFKFVVNGARLYDPSKDSTKPGGIGPQRRDDPSTWGGDGDYLPAVQAYNLLLGIEYDGKWLYGLQGVSDARLPAANWIKQINKCRAEGDRYQCHGEVPVDIPLATTLEAVLTSCQGRISEVGGIYNIHVGEPDAPVASFTDDDIISTEEQSFTPFFGLADTINGVAATYPEPTDGWNVKAAPPLYRPDLEVLAGNRRLMADIELPFVPDSEQVQRLMKSALAEAQRARRHTLVLPPSFWPYAVPGAVLSWTSERNGYVNKLFRVDGAVDRANLDVMIDITEVDPADFDWNPSTDYQEPVDGAVGVLRPAPQPLVGWQVFPATIGQPGKELPSIRVSYPGNLDDIRAVRVQVRLAGETDPFFDGEVPYGDPATNSNPASVVLFGTFAPDTDHQARGILVPYGDRETDWSEWLAVKTPNVWVADIYPVDLNRLADDIRGFQEWAGSGLREIERRLEEYDLWMADQDFGNAYDRQKLRQQITATYEQSKAEWTYEVNVLAAADVALGQRIEALDAEVGNNTAAINAEAIARANADGALAADILELETEVFDPATGLAATANAVDALETSVSEIDGEVTAIANAVTSLSAATTPGEVNEANFRMQAVAGPTGYSRIALQTRQGGTGAWRGASLFLDTPNNPALPTRTVIDAQEMVFGDMSSGATINPLVYSSGVWAMNVANIGTVNAGIIKSLDDKFVITVSEGKIEWFD